MSKHSFSTPQRQSIVGLALIFATSLFNIARNLWVVLVYFFIGEFNSRTLLLAGAGVAVVLVASMAYSIVYYLNFKFHVDEENEEFILQKGVLSTDVLNIPFQKIQQVNFRRDILQRVIGVYSVVIETAGSQDKEVEIKALSLEKANLLSEILMRNSGEEKEQYGSTSYNALDLENAEGEKEKTSADWDHEVSLLNLIKIGLTSNYLRGVGILLAFYFTLREQFMFNDSLSEELSNPERYFAQGKYMLIIFLLILGMFITVGETIIKYFGLHVKKYKDRLQVEMGLRNNTRINLKASRIQMLQVLTNPVQKKLELLQVKFSLASSQNELEKKQIKVVGLPPQIVSQIKQYIFRSEVEARFTILPSKFLLFKKLSRGLLPLAIGAVVWYFYAPLFTVAGFILVGVAYVVLMSLYNYLYYKNLKLGVSEEFLIKHSGVWTKKVEILEMFRLQAISLKQPIWYKKRELVNIIIHSAGGDISFGMVKKEHVQPLLNYLLYKIESTNRPWM
jgi:putative membrane protein